MRQVPQQAIIEQIKSTIAGLGCQYVGHEWITGGIPIWRIYVEGQEGKPITLAEITLLTKQLSALLDVEMPQSGQYRLEISSPGLERRLFSLADYQRFQGHLIKMRLHIPIEERRNWEGEIMAVKDHNIVLKVEDKTIEFAFDNIEKANLSIKWSEKK